MHCEGGTGKRNEVRGSKGLRVSLSTNTRGGKNKIVDSTVNER
jgi:hypothetical protein